MNQKCTGLVVSLKLFQTAQLVLVAGRIKKHLQDMTMKGQYRIYG